MNLMHPFRLAATKHTPVSKVAAAH